MKTLGYWWDDRYDGGMKEVEKYTFIRIPQIRNHYITACVGLHMEQEKNGGMKSAQNWRNMRDKEI